jgi:acyl transferase domain-containing protein
MSIRTAESHSKDVAVIGMACRIPGAQDINQFWENLRDGVESISFFSKDELMLANLDPDILNTAGFVNAGSVLEDVDKFDAAFFGFNPREAECMDPQQRFFLECAWHALEDGGYDPELYPGDIGVYAGCAMSSYLRELEKNPELMDLVGYIQVLIGNDKDYLTTHVSYKLNLRGPSLSVQTACSTSLLAISLAYQDLVSHNCDMALAGGACIRLPQTTGYHYEPGGILSPDGHCRVFDSKAQGVVFGNGIGVVLLKRLVDAEADGDSIYAVIKGTAVNNDGALKSSYTAPGLAGQVQVITRAQKMAGVHPDSIGYVETHGTGTVLGDPIEIAALTQAFRTQTTKRNFCAVGSVKSNVGHLDPAAGVTGFMKTVLSLDHKQIFPTLHCDTPNPNIDFAASPFYVNTILKDWISDQPRRAAVSAFGIGGTNVHTILEEAPIIAPSESHRKSYILLVSANTSAALEVATSDLLQYLEQNSGINPADLAYTSQVGRRAFVHRRALVYRSIADAVTPLAILDPKRILTGAQTPQARPVIFMFPGQGTQYVNMSLGLYRTEPTFRRYVDLCSESLHTYLGRDLREIIYAAPDQVEEATLELTQTRIAQPALFTIEYALGKLWTEWGLIPQAMIGHSIGEYVAGCVSGVLSLPDALMLVSERGRLMQQLPPGSMMAVGLTENEVIPLLGSSLSIAAVNEPAMCVVSGPAEEIQRLAHELESSHVQCQRLHTSHAFHSAMMDAMLEEFRRCLSKVQFNAPTIPYVSNLTGDWINASETTSPAYWCSHLRQTVRFHEGLTSILKWPKAVFVEVGPGHSLSTFVHRHPGRDTNHLAISSLRHPFETQDDSDFLHTALARLWLSGAPIDWKGFNANERLRRIHLPLYPFERQRYWVTAPDETTSNDSALQKNPEIADWFYQLSWLYTIKPERSDASELALLPRTRWLIFEDPFGWGRQVADELERQGNSVVLVRRGSAYLKQSATSYEIDPANPEDYVTLVRDLETSQARPQRILHLWTINGGHADESDPALFDQIQTVGFYSLAYTAQALIRIEITEPVEIAVISNEIYVVNGKEQVRPEKATLLGACKTIPQEYPNILCRIIDLEVAGSRALDQTLVAALVADLSLESKYTVVAYRGGQRWAQQFERCHVDVVEEDVIPQLRRGGTYVITGGLGNIGLSIAHELARSAEVNLVLVGRSHFPKPSEWPTWLETHSATDGISRKIQRLRDIKSFGSKLLILSADLSEECQARFVVQETRARFGEIRGVIHGAGNVSKEGFFGIDQASPTLCERQFGAKVRGLLNLHQLLQDDDIDFWILLSSISSILGGVGYVAYSAANCFLDAFAWKQSQSSPVPFLSVNWDTWAPTESDDSNEESATSELMMYHSEGVEALRRLFTWVASPQIVVSTGDLQARIDQWVERSLQKPRQLATESTKHLYARPDLVRPFVAPRTKLEHAIAMVWQETLGVAQVGVFDNFFTDLRGSSLVATQLVARLRNIFKQELPLRQFFEGPTVAELAGSIEATALSRSSPAP